MASQATGRVPTSELADVLGSALPFAFTGVGRPDLALIQLHASEGELIAVGCDLPVMAAVRTTLYEGDTFTATLGLRAVRAYLKGAAVRENRRDHTTLTLDAGQLTLAMTHADPVAGHVYTDQLPDWRTLLDRVIGEVRAAPAQRAQPVVVDPALLARFAKVSSHFGRGAMVWQQAARGTNLIRIGDAVQAIVQPMLPRGDDNPVVPWWPAILAGKSQP
ncbi:hypothetical protein [Nocardia sp. IFM 10818]